MAVELHGYQYSVYSWIARLALHEKGVMYSWVEVNPFAENVAASYLATHPFKRVPALVHGGFEVYETSAITRAMWMRLVKARSFSEPIQENERAATK